MNPIKEDETIKEEINEDELNEYIKTRLYEEKKQDEQYITKEQIKAIRGDDSDFINDEFHYKQ